METAKMSELPQFEYDDDALVPVISADLLRLHHAKQHAGYVNGANTILKLMNKSRDERADFNTKATFKELSYHIDGYLLHSLFWENLAPSRKGGSDKPSGQDRAGDGVPLLRAFQKGFFADGDKHRGLGLGSSHLLQEDVQAHHAGRGSS